MRIHEGDTFGDLTVISKVGMNSGKHMTWLCRCTCGTEVIKSTSQLTRGLATSCGCKKPTGYCVFSKDCFTCPLPDCRISSRDAKNLNRLDHDK